MILTTIFCLFVILLVFIVPCYASVKEKTEIKNMKTNNMNFVKADWWIILLIFKFEPEKNPDEPKTDQQRLAEEEIPFQ